MFNRDINLFRKSNWVLLMADAEKHSSYHLAKQSKIYLQNKSEKQQRSKRIFLQM